MVISVTVALALHLPARQRCLRASWSSYGIPRPGRLKSMATGSMRLMAVRTRFLVRKIRARTLRSIFSMQFLAMITWGVATLWWLITVGTNPTPLRRIVLAAVAQFREQPSYRTRFSQHSMKDRIRVLTL